MDLEERDRLCNEELDYIIQAAKTIKEDANEAASQKSGALRLIIDHINDTLRKLDSADK